MAKEVLVLHYNHFDPTWRRCFDRSSTYNGVTVRSYAEVEEHCINSFLALAGYGGTFVEGQGAVLRKYMQRNPDKRERLAELARGGQLALLCAGEVIQDSNLPSAEGLVRNYLAAQDIYQELLGAPPTVAMTDDAFGNSPNMPQVFRLIGCDMVSGLSYRPCPNLRWQGIDGSWVYVGDGRPKAILGDFAKQPPCKSCHGQGCADCDNTGMALIPGFDLAAVAAGLDKAIADERPWVEVDVFSEELRPDPKVADLVEQYRARYAGQCDIRWANLNETLARYKAEIAAPAAAEELKFVDLNPAMSGCTVSRIAVKQRARAVAYKLLAAEAELANAAWRRGEPTALPEEFAPAWRNLAFTQFHDAITGTHIDSANIEITEMQDAAEAVAQRHLPRQARKGGPGKFSPAQGGRGVKQWGKLKVEFDRVGIVALLCDGQDLMGQLPPSSRLRRALRVGELTLEADFGDAWGTRLPPFTDAIHDHSLVALGDYNESVEVAANGIRWRGRYTGGDPLVKKLAWSVSAAPSPDRRRLEFTTQVNWDTCSKRLRVVVPVASTADSATYEVPFGFVERKFDPAALNYSQWQGNDMTWPTLHWANRRLDERRGVAVLNRGLPGYRWMSGRFDVSLLRSPQWQFCSVETGSYEFWDIDGQRDAGRHTLEYAIWPYTDGVTEGDLTRGGYEYNMLCPIRLPFGLEGDVVVTAWKPAQDGQGWIVRLQEASGRDGGQVGLLLGKDRSVTVSDLLERPLEAPTSTGHFQRTLHKHEILTVRIL